MSSDTYLIEIRKLEGTMVELLCTTLTAGGLNDFACTRSFALMAIEDGMSSARTLPLQRALAATAPEGRDWPRIWDEAWPREHVAKFIASTELVERVGIIADSKAWWAGRVATQDDDEVMERDYPLHQFTVRVHMTDPRWLEGVTVGARYGTTAFDIWYDDPARPSEDAIEAVGVAASLWTGPGSPR